MRPVLIALVGVLIGAGVATALIVRSHREPEWGEVAIDRVVFSEDRSTVWALAEEYQSPSCYEHRLAVERSGTRWAVHLQARRTSDWCTAEGCIEEAPDSRGVTEPPSSTSAAAQFCPPWYRLNLDEPAPPDVELRVAQ